MALFIDRAQAARPGFRLTEENAPAVAALCDRLEGLPLALELAAARASVLTPSQILPRLQQRFELLVSPRRDISDRHRSLRAAIEWSYQLLSPALQRFFCRLSVFRGGWTLEAAETVCSEVGLPPPTYRWGGDLLQTAPPRVENPAALEHLEQLRECSLVIAEEAPSGGEMRYRLLESVREFAAEQLSPEEADRLARRHLYYHLPLAHALRHKVTEAQTAEAEKQRLRDVEREYENLRAALEWGLQHDPAAALWLAAAMAVYWYIHGYWAEALAFLPLAARYESAATMEMRAKALRYAGDIAAEVADYARAEAWLNEAAALGRQMGEPETLALARVYEGRTEPDPVVDRNRQMGASEYEAAALFNLGEIALARGDYDRARTLFQRSLDLRRGLWSDVLIISPLAGLGDVALALGEYETARACYSESLTISRAGNRQRDAAQRLLDLSTVARHRGEYEQASEYVREGLEIFQDYGDKACVAAAYRCRGDLALAQGRHVEAQDCYQESLMILRQVGDRRAVAGILEGLARLSHVDPAGDMSRKPQGPAPPLRGSPPPSRAQGGERAALLLGAAHALRQAIGSPSPPNEQPALDSLAAALRQSLGKGGYTAAWETGHTLTWEQAAAVALDES